MSMNKNGRKIFFEYLLLLWAILCVSYFIGFPGRQDFLQKSNLDNWHLFIENFARLNVIAYFSDLLTSFIGILLLFPACCSLGMSFINILGVRRDINSQTPLSNLAYLMTSFIVGSGIFSIIFLTIAGLGNLSHLSVAIILLAGFILGLPQCKQYVSTYCSNSLLPRFIETKSEKAIFWLSITILFLSILHATARISYDSTAIYFSDAKLTALTHHVQYFTDDTFIASVFQSVIQFTVLIQLFGDQSARMLSWVYGVVIIIFSLAFAEHVGLSKASRTILLALLLTSTAFIDLMGDGKVDLISTAPAIASVYWMAVSSQNNTPNIPKLLLTGFLVGLACVARPFNVFLLGVFALLYYFQQAFIQKPPESRKPVVFFLSLIWIGLGATGWAIYHLFANWMILGSPFAFLSSISAINPSAGPWTYSPNTILITRLLYPLVVTFINHGASLGNISTLFIALVPLLIIQKPIKCSNHLLIRISVVALITLLGWIFLFFTVVEIRYVFFLWILLFFPAAMVISNIFTMKKIILRTAALGTIFALLIFSVIRTIYISFDTYSPLDAQGNPHCSGNDFCDIITTINETAPIGARVLTLHPSRYYLRSDLFACSTTHNEYQILKDFSYSDYNEFWKEVYRLGYEYIAFEKDYTTRHLQMGFMLGPENVPAWIRLEQLFGNPEGTVIAYRIYYSNPPINVEFECGKDANGVWILQEIAPPKH
jgi:hypothetical protein